MLILVDESLRQRGTGDFLDTARGTQVRHVKKGQVTCPPLESLCIGQELPPEAYSYFRERTGNIFSWEFRVPRQ
jgi:hypothetical protein